MSKEKQSFDIADKLNFEKKRRGEYARRIVEAVRYEGADDHEDVHSILCDYRDEIIAGYRKQSENVIELPCKVGDTVYVPWRWAFQQGVATVKVEEIKFYDSQMHYMFLIDMESDNECFNQSFGGWKLGKSIGETVFLTREEAEAKMKGGE